MPFSLKIKRFDNNKILNPNFESGTSEFRYTFGASKSHLKIAHE
jgi:hypothetical protein